ncbi:MAG: rod shape-determining protein MreC [Deltaproteobacteria bacterium]|nr:rod shape-determining protein MreC [Deltaproteobacteria bacterium]
MFALLKQYRELVVFLGLLGIGLASYLSHAKQGRDLNRFDRVVLATTGPLERGMNAAVGWVEDEWNSYVDLRGVRAQNQELRAQLLHLQDENLALQESKLENERLRQLLDFARPQASPTVVAQVVGTGLTTNFLSVRVSRGSNDGLRKGMAVVTPTGVVGKVQDVGQTYSDVELFTDIYSKIAVEDQKSRARATVIGGGENKRAQLVNAEHGALIEDGDLLITSGTDGVFPKGLAVGRVTHLDKHKTGFYVAGEVEPAVELSTVEEVLVLTAVMAGHEGNPSPVNSASNDKPDANSKMGVLKAGVAP